MQKKKSIDENRIQTSSVIYIHKKLKIILIISMCKPRYMKSFCELRMIPNHGHTILQVMKFMVMNFIKPGNTLPVENQSVKNTKILTS